MVAPGDVAVYTLSRESWLQASSDPDVADSARGEIPANSPTKASCVFEMHVVATTDELKKYVTDFMHVVFEEKDFEWEDDTRALVCRISYRGKKQASPFAYLFLSEDYMGTSVLLHEATHLALAYMRNMGMKFPGRRADVDDAEEDLCYLAGDMAAGIVSALRDHGHIE